MSKLSNPKKTIAVVSEADFDFRKRLGQNFLVNEDVILHTLDAASIGKEDVVFEIGPGIGTLTQYLCERAHKVAAIEIDDKLIPVLGDTLKKYDNVQVIHQDVLKTDLLALAGEYEAGYGQKHPLKIVANLPYYITTPILMYLFRQKVPAKTVTVMVQQEVAGRMTAEAGSKAYGSLSVAVQYYSHPEIVEIVPPECFIPRPKVTSAVVKMELYEDLPLKPENEELFSAVTRAAFGQRRKTLVNALGSSAAVGKSKDRIREALEEMGLHSAARGETLTLEQFVQLSDILEASSHTSPES